jgi:DivIVA domain-containing protein
VTWLFTLLGMAVIALGAALVTGRITGGMDAPAPSVPFRPLPPDGVIPSDLAALRFTPVLRGYKMAEVDVVLDRLIVELADRDEQISRLRTELAAVPVAAQVGDDTGSGADTGPDQR